MNNLIVNVALTGMVPTKEQNPNVPYTPKEIAHEILRCHNEGATIFHVHARNEWGKPAGSKEQYQQIITAARVLVPDAIICVSTSGRARSELAFRMEPLLTNADMASLTLGSMNFPSQASVNSPKAIGTLAEMMKQQGIRPELEVFEIGMINYASYLVKKGVFEHPLYFNLFMGNLGTIRADPLLLATMVREIPLMAMWAATGIGRYQFEVNCYAVAMGGHVRVGLEDALYMDGYAKEEKASNPRLVKRIVGVGRAMGREPATTKEVRELLCLGK